MHCVDLFLKVVVVLRIWAFFTYFNLSFDGVLKTPSFDGGGLNHILKATAQTKDQHSA